MDWASDTTNDFVWSKQNWWKRKWDAIPNSVTAIEGIPTTIKINTDENGTAQMVMDITAGFQVKWKDNDSEGA